MAYNYRQAHKDFLVFGGEGIVMTHQTLTVENRPIYIQRRDPVQPVPCHSSLRERALHTSGSSGKTVQQNTQALQE